MPLYDFECGACGHVVERIAPMDQDTAVCPKCHGEATRIISSRSAYRNDPDWVASCVTGFDPSDTRPEVRAYLANPADKNALARAMRAAGIRHKDHGEDAAIRRDKASADASIRSAINNETIERFKARHGR
jgi:putative FmdB family regulatory protein